MNQLIDSKEPARQTTSAGGIDSWAAKILESFELFFVVSHSEGRQWLEYVTQILSCCLFKHRSFKVSPFFSPPRPWKKDIFIVKSLVFKCKFISLHEYNMKYPLTLPRSWCNIAGIYLCHICLVLFLTPFIFNFFVDLANEQDLFTTRCTTMHQGPWITIGLARSGCMTSRGFYLMVFLIFLSLYQLVNFLHNFV